MFPYWWCVRSKHEPDQGDVATMSSSRRFVLGREVFGRIGASIQRNRRCGSVLILVAMVFVGASSGQLLPHDLATFLQNQLDFSVSDLAEIARGHVVTKKLPADNNREIALVGVTRLPTTKDRLLQEFRNGGSIVQGEHTSSIGIFASNPQLDDLNDLTVTDGDLDAIRHCRTGDCDVNLPQSLIGELQRLDESSGTYGETVSIVLRETLLEYVRRYLAEGDSALVVYDHKREPLSLADGFGHLLSESPYPLEHIPELHRYLEAFPRDHIPNVDGFLYWTVEEFGLRPLTSVTHATIFDRSFDSVPQALVLMKQIYASHYFHASLKVLALVSEHAGLNEQGLYLVYLDRSLFDSKIGGLKRMVAERELRENLENRLESIRLTFEDPS